MNKRVLIGIILAGFIAGFTSQCVKAPKGVEPSIPESELIIPPNFNWETINAMTNHIHV